MHCGSPCEGPLSLQEHPLEGPWTARSTLSRVQISWIWPLLRAGLSRPLDEDDVWRVPSRLSARAIGSRAEELWRHECRAAAERGEEPRLLLPVLVAVARCSLALYSAFSMSCVVYYCCAPSLLRMFLQDLERGAERPGMLLHGAGFAACYFAVSLCVGVTKWYSQVAGTQLRLAVQRLVYNACLLMPVDGAAGVSNPMNLMSVDAERFFLVVNATMPHIFAMLWVFPVLLIFQLGVAPAAACMTSTVFTTLLQRRIARHIALSRQRSMRASDRRLALTEQFLDGIRILKITAWTDYAAERLASARDAELAITRRVLIWKGVNLTVGLASPALAGFWMFSTYALLGGHMTADVIFPALTVLKAMQVFMGNMPTAFSNIAEFLTALARVKAFLLRHLPGDAWKAEERHCKPGVPAVSLQQAAWSRCDDSSAGASQDGACAARTFSVGPVSLDLQLGDLCVICGPVGSGKSTLLLGMLRELASRQGRVEVRGSAALCGQEPWIRTATVRDNVRCLRPEDPEAYSRAVEAAQLVQDLQSLPAGDETEIGAQGINLSGGQKARIALARAIFGVGKSDMVFLDDVLSAVDGHVAQCIIQDVILAHCKLKGRTCALVANTFLPLILPHANSVVVLAEGGRVDATGHPKNAMLESQWLRQVVEAMGGCEIDEERDEASCVRDSRCDVTASRPDTLLQQRPLEDPRPKQLGVDVMRKGKSADGSLHVAEERRVGVMDLRAYAAYFRQATPGQSLGAGLSTFAVVVALVALAEACRTSTELWVMFWVQQASRDGENGKDFWIGIYSSLLAALICVSGAQVAIFTWAVAAIGRQTHSSMLSKVLGASVPLYFDVTPLGRILNRFSKDLDALDLQLPEMMSEFFQGLAYVLATAAIFVSASYWLIFVLVPLFVVFVRIRRFYSATSRELKRLEAITRSPLYVHFSETMAGRVHIRAFSLMPQMLEEFETRVDRNARIFIHQYALAPWLIYRVNMLASTLLAGVMVISSFLAGPGDSALIGLTLASGAGLIGKLHSTVTFSIETENHFTAVERLEQFQRAPQERAEPGGRPGIPAGWPEHGEVVFEDVRMRYRPGLPLVLNGVSFRVAPGQRAGIIGRTGSGKSSCMLVLLRLVEPCGGRVLLDGVDVSEVPLRVLRGQAMAIIPQDPYLFAGSVHENLDPRRAASPEAVWRALEEARLADTVRAAGGLDAEVQGKGANFSVGQRQLLCIARALLRRSPVVLLDEATANIDAATDMLIQRTIRAGFCGSTALIIAHRLSTISDVDVVLCLEGGRLAEAGSLGELRRAGGHVAKMFDDAGDMALESADRSPGPAILPPGSAASPICRSGIELAKVGHAQSCVAAGCVCDSRQRCTVQ